MSAGKRGFSGGGCPDHPHGISGLHCEAHPVQHRQPVSRRHENQFLHLQPRRRAGERHRRTVSGLSGKEMPEPRPRQARRLHQAPLPHQRLDRGESAAQQHRRGDHHPGRDFVAQHQPGAQCEHGRLEELPENLRGRTEDGAQISGSGGALQHIATRPLPAIMRCPAHAKRAQGPRLGTELCGQTVGRDPGARGFAALAPGRHLVR